MIRISRRRLPRAAQQGLAGYQAYVDAALGYPARVERAKNHFSARNRPDDSVFKVVRSVLDSLCTGPRRCMYCEGAPADEIEHFRPKDLYPEEVFVWKNYLYACGPCNGPKNNRFAVLSGRPLDLLDVTRKRGAAVTPPASGRPALINPFAEDPLEFFQLDMANTFAFVPIARFGTVEYKRAIYTLEVLRLNDREYLLNARRSAYAAFAALLYEYINRRSQGEPQTTLSHISDAIRRAHHPTVWAEMKRQSKTHPSLRPLFRDAPEALNW